MITVVRRKQRSMMKTIRELIRRTFFFYTQVEVLVYDGCILLSNRAPVLYHFHFISRGRASFHCEYSRGLQNVRNRVELIGTWDGEASDVHRQALSAPRSLSPCGSWGASRSLAGEGARSVRKGV